MRTAGRGAATSLPRAEQGQIHILEMATLVWLFFMSATFVIQIHIPDPPAPTVDATLLLAAEDALQLADSEPANDTVDHTSLLGERLSAGELDSACDLVLSGLPAQIEGNCWLALGGAPIERQGSGAVPIGRSITVHRLVQDSGQLWTVSCQAWYLGGGV